MFEGDAMNDTIKDYFGYRANPGPADISARLRNAYDSSVGGLPRGMVPMQPQKFQHPDRDSIFRMMFFGDRT